MFRLALAAFMVLHAPAVGAQEIPLVQTRIGSGEAAPNGIVKPPQAFSYSYPSYTDEARNLGIEGVVTVEAAFDIQGDFRVLRVVRGLGYGLDKAALETLAGWQFSPAQRNGALAEVVAQIDIGFSLLREEARRLREGALPVGNGVSTPRIVNRSVPTYPDQARAERVQGTVVLETVVLEDGSTRVVSVLEGLGSGLDENAIQSVEAWQFEPGTRDGEPVKVALTIEVNFSLR